MRTERRLGLRKSMQADVVIDNQPASLLRGRISNVSVGGLYVCTIPAALAPHSRVELVFMRQVDGVTRVYRLSAMVVRRANEGVGLLINHYDLDAFRALVALLLEQAGSWSEAPAGAEKGERQTLSSSVNTGDEQAAQPGIGGNGRDMSPVSDPSTTTIRHNEAIPTKKEPS